MTSLTALRDASEMAEGESPTNIELRLAEVKEAYIESEITEMEFDELLDACLAESAPYLADVIREDDRTMEIPVPEDRDEEVYQNRGTFYTIDGNLAREREPPEWENVFDVVSGKT